MLYLTNFTTTKMFANGNAENIMHEFQEIPDCKNFFLFLNRITQNKLHYSEIIWHIIAFETIAQWYKSFQRKYVLIQAFTLRVKVNLHCYKTRIR